MRSQPNQSIEGDWRALCGFGAGRRAVPALIRVLSAARNRLAWTPRGSTGGSRWPSLARAFPPRLTPVTGCEISAARHCRAE